MLIKYWARATASGFPLMVMVRSVLPPSRSSQFEIRIMAPEIWRISAILVPPFPIMQPIKSFGTVISCCCVFVCVRFWVVRNCEPARAASAREGRKLSYMNKKFHQNIVKVTHRMLRIAYTLYWDSYSSWYLFGSIPQCSKGWRQQGPRLQVQLTDSSKVQTSMEGSRRGREEKKGKRIRCSRTQSSSEACRSLNDHNKILKKFNLELNWWKTFDFSGWIFYIILLGGTFGWCMWI